ncbi:hypothetical protein EBR03_08210 [bacterium]|nr:hypothetical protein [bacterium]
MENENMKEFYYVGKSYNKKIDGIYDRWKVLDVLDDVPHVEFLVQGSKGVYKSITKDDLLDDRI